MNLNLSNKTFLISGSSRGIGLKIAENLLSEGANTIITGRSKNLIKKQFDKLYSRFGLKIAYIDGDITSNSVLKKINVLIRKRWKKLDTNMDPIIEQPIQRSKEYASYIIDAISNNKEITINAPEGAKIEGLQIEQTISQPADLEVGPVKVGDASVLTWSNAGIVIVLVAAVVIGKKLLSK